MKHFVVLLLVAALMIPNTPILAEAFIHFDLLQVDIWPEYDRPEMFITYKMTLAADVTLPVELKLRIPAESGRPTSLVRRDLDGLFYPLSYTIKPDGQWLQVSFTTSSSQVQLEYYDPNWVRDGIHRHFDYTWPGDYFVHQLTLRVQHPVNAANLDVSPSPSLPLVDGSAATLQQSASQAGTARSEIDGFFYDTILFNNIYGSPLRIAIKYDQPDSALSSNLKPVQLLHPVQTESSLVLALKTIPWVPLTGGIILIIIAIFALLEGGRHMPLVTAQYDEEGKGNKKVVYCQNCGKRADPKKENICPSCGQKLPSA